MAPNVRSQNRKSFIIQYDVYNIHIIITLNYIFIYQNSNFHETKQFKIVTEFFWIQQIIIIILKKFYFLSHK